MFFIWRLENVSQVSTGAKFRTGIGIFMSIPADFKWIIKIHFEAEKVKYWIEKLCSLNRVYLQTC